MTSPRRAAAESVEVITHDSASPRRGSGSAALLPLVRKTVAPLAIVGVLAASAVLCFVDLDGSANTSVADPLHQAQVDLGVSRSRERQPLADLPTAGPVPTMAASIVPSMPAAPAATPTVATASPTPTPDTVAPSPSQTDLPAAAAAPADDAASASPAAPAVDWSVLGEDAGVLYAAASVNVRTGPSTDHDVIKSVSTGTEMTITDTVSEGWQQVVVKEQAGWIKASFLSKEKPAGGSSGGIDTSSCSVSGSTSGMTSNTIQVRNAVCNAFPAVSSIGGYRAGSGSYHGSGRAVDVMISGEAGWEVARWARANASNLGVIEVIYQQKIWTSQRSGDGWRSMSDRGSASANHYDHVHISVR